jgi:hypothetical protein
MRWRKLLGEAAPQWLQRILPYPDDGWGAFTLYLGVDEKIFSARFCDASPNPLR